MSIRRTKIVATLGPASNSPEVIEQLILAGLDVARLNFSHGTPDEHKARARLIRDIAAKNGRHVALLGDLQGPKIRIAKFANKRIELKIGDKFTFSTAHPLTEGNQTSSVSTIPTWSRTAASVTNCCSTTAVWSCASKLPLQTPCTAW
jgi:pyruvate kinase (EC 2.7.1.40)